MGKIQTLTRLAKENPNCFQLGSKLKEIAREKAGKNIFWSKLSLLTKGSDYQLGARLKSALRKIKNSNENLVTIFKNEPEVSF